MQQPGSPEGSLLPAKPWKRLRQHRTVFSIEQRERLEKFFENDPYPTYYQREALAVTLNIREQQVQVWLKNRRVKERKLQKLSLQKDLEAVPGTQRPRVCAPAPASVGPVFSRGAMFTGGSGGGSDRPPGAFGSVPAAGPSLPSHSHSHSQAWHDLAQGAQNKVPAAPAPAQGPSPVWSQGPDASYVSPDPYGFLSFQQLLSPQEPWLSGQQGAEGPVELTLLQGLGAGTGSQHPGAGAPAPAPVGPLFSEGPMLTGGPAFPGGPGGRRAPPPNPFGGIEATQPSASSHSQAWGDQAQGAQNLVPAAAPVLPQGYNGSDFSPDLFAGPFFPELLSPHKPSLSESQEGEESVDEDDGRPKEFWDL